SRQHARILCHEAAFFVEDLDSSNGTFLNGQRLPAHVQTPLADGDTVQIGPYLFGLRPDGAAGQATPTESNLVVRERLSADALNQSLYGQDPAHKLQVILEIAQNLGRTLELDPLLDKLLEQIMRLFPQSDRSLVILYEGDKLMVRAQRSRGARDETAIPYSRTIVRSALEEGVGLLSEDVQVDQRFRASDTLTSLGLHSVLCVPLITQEGRRLGVIQIDRFRKGGGYRVEDLQLLTAIGLQVAVVLENVELHGQLLREERLHQELALARDIQQGFLPRQIDGLPLGDLEVFGRVFPARQVAGDLYDYFQVGGGRLAFFIGDVSGKGMPAALFMVAVRTLCRHLAAAGGPLAETLTRLNADLADDNPSCMFVTLVHGYYEPATGVMRFISAGHPGPVIRRAGGAIEEVGGATGRLLGYDTGNLNLQEVEVSLQPGDLAVFVTDGLLEARSPVDKALFGGERLRDLVSGFLPNRPLADCAEQARITIELFTGSKDLQDDLTLLLLRRRPPNAS
ncbi:MAG TPA: SpoIIE family protein phosphatase, partial [Pirellulales bacterium]|nr:SpoIIE family protein phosphatase [Pirellulales bacterium]